MGTNKNIVGDGFFFIGGAAGAGVHCISYSTFSNDSVHPICLQPLFVQVCKDLRANIHQIVGITVAALVGIVLLCLAAVFIIFAMQVTSAGTSERRKLKTFE